MNINNGTLNVNGWYKLQDEEKNTIEEIIEREVSAKINMTNVRDKINVDGDFIVHTGEENVVNNGVINIGGNFIQKNSEYGDGRGYFKLKGNNKVILKGKRDIVVGGEDRYFQFGQLEIENGNTRKIIFKDHVNVEKLLSPVTVISDELKINKFDVNRQNMMVMGDIAELGDVNLTAGEMTVNGDIFQDSDVDLNFGTLNVNGNLRQTGGTMDINNGTLNIKGWYKLQNEEKNTIGEIVEVPVDAKIKMTNARDKVNVDGDFVIHSKNGSTLTDGAITIKGNFKQKNGGNNGNFNCNGNHWSM